MKLLRIIITLFIIVISYLCFMNIYNNLKFKNDNKINNKGNTLAKRIYNISKNQINSNKLYKYNEKYIFCGHANNYILFKNELYRIVSLENDGTIKIIKNDTINKKDYLKYYENEIKNNIIFKNKFNNALYNIADINSLDYIKKLEENYIIDYVGNLNIKDVILASTNVYFDEYLDIYFWVNKKYNYLYVDNTWNLSNNYYVSGDFIKIGVTNNYRPVIFLNKNFLLDSGKGTKTNPYILGELNE